ncbi:MAG: hypothetical protein JO280_12460 [Mycobacteriaceae bacterium]|nr:hypothetical protein [Mycobacteriaceae bacterium]
MVLNGPHGVAVYRNSVYVTDSGNNRVLRLTTDPNPGRHPIHPSVHRSQ